MSTHRESPALVRSLGRDEPEAFVHLYNELAGRLFDVVHRLLRDPAMSEEVTQEVFVEIWRTIDRFDPSLAPISAWAVNIARCRAIDHIRREQRYRNRVRNYGFCGISLDPSVDDTIVARLDADLIRQAIARLPHVQREIVELAFIGGHTHRAISSRLDLPLGTVKGRLRSGLRRLRNELRTDLG